MLTNSRKYLWISQGGQSTLFQFLFTLRGKKKKKPIHPFKKQSLIRQAEYSLYQVSGQRLLIWLFPSLLHQEALPVGNNIEQQKVLTLGMESE